MPNRKNIQRVDKDAQIIIWFKIAWGGILSVALILLMS